MPSNPCKLTRVVRQDDRSRTWKNAQIMRLVKAIRDLARSEVQLAPCTYTQDPALRLIVRDQADEVAAMILAEDRR